MGKTIVFTDKTDLTASQIVEIYDTRNTIESDIRWLKNKLLIFITIPRISAAVRCAVATFDYTYSFSESRGLFF